MSNKERIELIKNAKLNERGVVIEIKNVNYYYNVNFIKISFNFRIINNNLKCTKWLNYYINSIDKLTKNEIINYLIKELKTTEKYNNKIFYSLKELK